MTACWYSDSRPSYDFSSSLNIAEPASTRSRMMDCNSFFVRLPTWPVTTFSAALHHAEGDFFILATCASDFSSPFVFVHVPRLATDEGFINFNFATQLIERPVL